MSETFTEQKVNCRRCRYCLIVQVPSVENWRVEAQCPACDSWAWFSINDAPNFQPPHGSPECAKAIQQHREQWKPIDEYHHHPAIAWIEHVGNGVFEDDHSAKCWRVPHWIYRFTRGQEAAYIWQEENSWFVRGWHPLRCDREPHEPTEVFSFEAALDQLLQ